MIKIFIGYDPREATAYHTCSNSIIRHSTCPLAITPLALNNFSFYNELHKDGSNEFIYSRFLVPHLTEYQGWAIYLDGDMVILNDIAKLWEMRDESKAVMCIQHNYKTKSFTKYFGSINENYDRKNWSSVILWNCAHPENKVLTPKFIQQSSGKYLHRFKWLNDKLIGSLPLTWNWLPDEFGINEDASLLHWTLGTPCLHDYSTATMSSKWHKEAQLASFAVQDSNFN